MLIRQDRFKLPPRVLLHNYNLGIETSILLLEFPDGSFYACVYEHARDKIIKMRLEGCRVIDFSLGIDLPMFRDTDTPYSTEKEEDLFPAIKMPPNGVKPFKLNF